MPFCATSLVLQKKGNSPPSDYTWKKQPESWAMRTSKSEKEKRKAEATRWFVVIAYKKKSFVSSMLSTHRRFFSYHLKQPKVHPPLDSRIFFLLSFEVIAQSRHGHIGQMVTYSQSVNHSLPNILIDKNCICWVQPLATKGRIRGCWAPKRRWTIEKLLFCQHYQFCQ